MFNLRAGNHHVILTSQRYASKAAALGGIESVRKNAASDTRFARLRLTGYGFQWACKCRNPPCAHR
ncbi:YegP family protein [Alcaligenaceae bacterium CGII-47]|nr:YegP family protein [Alcaligenaceae bacterium CGII-47]